MTVFALIMHNLWLLIRNILGKKVLAKIYFKFLGLGIFINVCVCMFHCQPNCTIMRLGFRTRQIDVCVVYFQFIYHLGRPCYVWDKYER